MFKDLKKKINLIKKSKKIKVFYFGNTVKKESSSFYVTSIQENKSFIYFGAIIYNNKIAKKISKIVDGNFNFILVDIEKKVISKDKKEYINIERSVKDTIKKNQILTYKGNDLTVQACETLINYLFLKDPRGIGGKKILVLGCGNIGFKLSLKFVESGANLYLFRRNKKILENIKNSINFIIPKATVAKAKVINDYKSNLNNFDIIICATNGVSLLKKHHVNKFKKNVVVIDIGKGIFEKQALHKAIKDKINLFRLDVTPAYDGYLENIVSTKKINNTSLKKYNLYKKLQLVKRGVLSLENSIIVDNVKYPKKIYGVSDGYGSFKKVNKKKNIKIKNIIKILNKVTHEKK